MTDEMKAELSIWVEGLGNKTLFNQVTSDAWMKKELTAFVEFDRQARADWSKVNESIFGSSFWGRTRRIPLWIRYSAVACLIIAMAFGVVRLFSNSEPAANAPITIDSNRIQPGKDSALLTFADGKSIPLEGHRDGIVSERGARRIVKRGGKLVYDEKNQGEDNIVEEYQPDERLFPGPYIMQDSTKSKESFNNFQQGTNSTEAFNTLTIPRGGSFMIVLPDGSKVWLNARSSLRYPVAFNGDERRVYLSGEAYFEVAAMPLKPFIVSVHRAIDKMAMDFRVTGTKFNINAYDDEPGIVASVTEGEVFAVTNSESHLIPAHGQLKILNGKYEVQQAVGEGPALAWKNGYFEFENIPIDVFLRQLQRWYDVDIIFKSANRKMLLGRIPRNSSFSRIAAVIEKLGFDCTINGKTVVVTDE